jgi:membrane protein implicated in regulation of membrane protease activity
MTEQKKRGVKHWLRVGGGWCLLMVGVAGLFLPIIQGLLCIAAGLTLLSTEYRWASVCLAWVKRKIHREKKEESAQHQPQPLAQLSAGHARGESPPKEKTVVSCGGRNDCRIR